MGKWAGKLRRQSKDANIQPSPVGMTSPHSRESCADSLGYTERWSVSGERGWGITFLPRQVLVSGLLPEYVHGHTFQASTGKLDTHSLGAAF